MASKSQQRERMQAAEETGSDPWILAAAGSVLLSWYFFFLRGDREMGQFVGLWPPTFLAFASYFRQTRMHDVMQRSMGAGGMMDRVERMMQGK